MEAVWVTHECRDLWQSSPPFSVAQGVIREALRPKAIRRAQGRRRGCSTGRPKPSAHGTTAVAPRRCTSAGCADSYCSTVCGTPPSVCANSRSETLRKDAAAWSYSTRSRESTLARVPNGLGSGCAPRLVTTAPPATELEAEASPARVRRTESSAVRRAACRHRQTRELPHPAALVRDSPARSRP